MCSTVHLTVRWREWIVCHFSFREKLHHHHTIFLLLFRHVTITFFSVISNYTTTIILYSISNIFILPSISVFLLLSRLVMCMSCHFHIQWYPLNFLFKNILLCNVLLDFLNAPSMSLFLGKKFDNPSNQFHWLVTLREHIRIFLKFWSLCFGGRVQL
jgi:hypothetical protein